MNNQSGKLPIILMIIIVVVLALGAGGFMFMNGKSKGGKKPEKKVELSEWKLEEFVVNLADQDEPRYLKVSMTLEVEGKVGGGGEGGGNPEEAKAQDAIINVLTAKRFSQLVAPGGKDKLKEELKAALNSSLEDIKVHGIYFTSFAMQ